MTVGAPIEVKPSTEAAVGSEMNSEPMRWLMTRVDVGDGPRSDPDEDARDAIECQQHLEGRASVRTDLVSLEHDGEHVPTLGAERRLGPRPERRIRVVVSDEGEMRKLTLPAEAHQFG